MGNTIWICVQIALTYVINSFTAINDKPYVPSPHILLISKSIDKINELSQHKWKIILYFEENAMYDHQLANIEEKTFVNELSDYCGNKNLHIALSKLYKSISRQLYKLWNSYKVAQWIIDLLKETITKDERQQINNAVREQKYTGEYIDDMDEDDIKGFGINDPKCIEIILIDINQLKMPQQKPKPVYHQPVLKQQQEKPQPNHLLQVSEDRKAADSIQSPLRNLEIIKKTKQMIALKPAIKKKSKNWNTEKIVKHILEIKGLQKYEKLIRNGLNNFNGYNISEVQKKDIKKWGIKKMKHRNQIYEQIQKLEISIVPPSTVEAKEINLNPLKSKKEKDRLKKLHLKLYDTVELEDIQKKEIQTKNIQKKKGVILYFGEVLYPSGNKMYKFGIELIDNNFEGGEHNGTFNNKEYFQLNNKNGIFVSSTQIIDKML